jgi:hypothetical protein
VPEETQNSEEKAKSIDPEVLRQQAEEIRQSAYIGTEEPPKPPARWVQIIYLAVLILVIGSALLLVASRGTRLWLLKGVAHAWSTVSSTQESAEIFKLPAPPPKTVEPKVIQQGSPSYTFRGASSGAAGQAEESAESAETESGAGAEADESKPPAPPEKTAGAKAAYDLLVKNSEVAQKLTTNAFPDLQFKEWKPVKNSPPEFWINVVASRAGQEVQFVWVVNTESGTIKALSQNARDLEQRK